MKLIKKKEEPQKEDILEIFSKIQGLRAEQDELYEQAREWLKVENNSGEDYSLFDLAFNGGDFEPLWNHLSTRQ